jgi:hypothetical protein
MGGSVAICVHGLVGCRLRGLFGDEKAAAVGHRSRIPGSRIPGDWNGASARSGGSSWRSPLGKQAALTAVLVGVSPQHLHATASGPAVQGKVVEVQLRTSRWRCRNPPCQRKTFADRSAPAAAAYARQTGRAAELVRLVGHAAGGRPAERLLPEALKVADRFHLVQNLRLAIERQLSRAPRPMKLEHKAPRRVVSSEPPTGAAGPEPERMSACLAGPVCRGEASATGGKHRRV